MYIEPLYFWNPLILVTYSPSVLFQIFCIIQLYKIYNEIILVYLYPLLYNIYIIVEDSLFIIIYQTEIAEIDK